MVTRQVYKRPKPRQLLPAHQPLTSTTPPLYVLYKANKTMFRPQGGGSSRIKTGESDDNSELRSLRLPMVRYEETRYGEGDDGTRRSRTDVRSRQQLSSNGIIAQEFGRYDDRHVLRRHDIRYLSPSDAKIQVPLSVKTMYDAAVRREVELPRISVEGIRDDTRLHDLVEVGSPAMINNYFDSLFTPAPNSRIQMAKYQTTYAGVVPRRPNIEPPRPPTAAILYGYSFNVFAEAEKEQPALTEAEATRSCLLYSFFTIDIQGDGLDSSGSLWAATNTCLASSAACVSLLNKLERRVKQLPGGAPPRLELQNIAFSIAMSGTEARLFVTYMLEDGVYGMYKARSYLLQDPDHHIRFRRDVLNILNWGQQRFDRIKKALMHLRVDEANRVTAVPTPYYRFPYTNFMDVDNNDDGEI